MRTEAGLYRFTRMIIYYDEGFDPNTPRGYHRIMIPEMKKRALHRSKILEGQMRGVQKMINEDQYCMDIITQTVAIQKSLNSLNKLILENHLRTHVKHMFEEGEVEKAVEELMVGYDLTKNRSVH